MKDDHDRHVDAYLKWMIDVSAKWGKVIFADASDWPPSLSEAYCRGEKVSNFEWTGGKTIERSER